MRATPDSLPRCKQQDPNPRPWVYESNVLPPELNGSLFVPETVSSKSAASRRLRRGRPAAKSAVVVQLCRAVDWTPGDN